MTEQHPTYLTSPTFATSNIVCLEPFTSCVGLHFCPCLVLVLANINDFMIELNFDRRSTFKMVIENVGESIYF